MYTQSRNQICMLSYPWTQCSLHFWRVVHCPKKSNKVTIYYRHLWWLNSKISTPLTLAISPPPPANTFSTSRAAVIPASFSPYLHLHPPSLKFHLSLLRPFDDEQGSGGGVWANMGVRWGDSKMPGGPYWQKKRDAKEKKLLAQRVKEKDMQSWAGSISEMPKGSHWVIFLLDTSVYSSDNIITRPYSQTGKRQSTISRDTRPVPTLISSYNGLMEGY